MKYTIGLDFGTLSVRAVLAQVSDGKIVSSFVSKYKHGVMDAYLKNGIQLPNDYALQDANDYIVSMFEVLEKVIKTNNVNSKNIIGIGVDFTSSTILPIKQDGTPLSELPELKNNPHAYVKLWKHHSAEKYAEKITELAIARKENWISRYGYKISSEWMLPKICEILNDDFSVYDKTDLFIEAGDFITYFLTGNLYRSSCQAGYKNIWHDQHGYPSRDFLLELNKKIANIYDTKLIGEVKKIGEAQGKLKPSIARRLGINQIPVAVALIDAHVASPSCQSINAGDMLIIAGTSSCDIVLSDKEVRINGIQGVVKDGAIPGLYAYESGQPAVGDMLSWYISNHVPNEYYQNACMNNQNIYQYMEDRISMIPNDKPRLLCLDWWNGNRSVLVNPNLTGLILGYNLQTSPEDIYRALIEATAFGKKIIVDAYESAGVEINRVIACGGLATKNKYLLKCYANILQKPVYFTDEEYAPALGAAIFGAVAAKSENGGYNSVNEAVKYMSNINEKPIYPNKDKINEYFELYQMYQELHDYFGKKSQIMKKLKNIVNN